VVVIFVVDLFGLGLLLPCACLRKLLLTYILQFCHQSLCNMGVSDNDSQPKGNLQYFHYFTRQLILYH